MRILVTGAAGQVGTRVAQALDGHEVLAATRDVVDLAEREQVDHVVAEFAPDVIVNAAAVTNVDVVRARPGTGVRGQRARRAVAGPGRGPPGRARRAHLHRLRVRRPDDPSLRRVGRARTRSPSTAAPSSAASTSSPVTPRSWATVRTSWVFGNRGTDLVSWAFDAHDRGELTGRARGPGRDPHLRARPRRDAGSVRGRPAPGALST